MNAMDEYRIQLSAGEGEVQMLCTSPPLREMDF